MSSYQQDLPDITLLRDGLSFGRLAEWQLLLESSILWASIPAMPSLAGRGIAVRIPAGTQNRFT
jgi:hypothetical protein